MIISLIQSFVLHGWKVMVQLAVEIITGVLLFIEQGGKLKEPRERFLTSVTLYFSEN